MDLVRFGDSPDNVLDFLVANSEGKSFLIDERNSLMDIDDTLAYISNRETSNRYFWQSIL